MAETEEKRVALVIGNTVYKHASTLMNPANDARAIGAALARLGFSGAKPQLNLDFNGLRRALQAFGVEADGANMAAIYFAGHGIEVDGRNFLIPVDAKLDRARDIEFETVPLDQALGAVDGARKLSLIVLDACRNNPFRARLMRSGGTRSFGQGLRAIEPSGNLLVAYAAKHGTYALDGKDGNSPYAEALLAHIEKPGIEIGQLFREVRDDVLERTGREQEPHLYGALGRDGIYLKPLSPPPEPNGEPPSPPPPNGSPGPSAPEASWMQQPLLVAGVGVIGVLLVALVVPQFRPNPAQCSSTDWDRAEQRQSLEGFQKFYADCQHTTYGIFAREELEKRDTADWDKAREAGATDAYRGYLDRWENQKPYRGRYMADAQKAMKTPVSAKPSGPDNAAEKVRQEAERAVSQDDTAFAAAKQTGSKAALTGYLQRYPQGRNVAAARAELARLGFVEVAVAGANDLRWFRAGGGKEEAETFKDCEDCPRMVIAPAGSFMMGSPDSEAERGSNEGPQHQVTIAKPFAVGQFEVTFTEWDACVAAGGCKQKPSDQGWGRGDRPVINVSWNDVSSEYLPWLSRKTGKTYRLLTEAEWEYAARAGTKGPFSFDGKITAEKANYDSRYEYDGSPKTKDYLAKTVPMKSFTPNPWGLYQVHGNVWEWVQDCKTDYKDTPRDGSAAATTEACPRVLRGGSWLNYPQGLRSADRSRSEPVNRINIIGFRVARTLTP